MQVQVFHRGADRNGRAKTPTQGDPRTGTDEKKQRGGYNLSILLPYKEQQNPI